MNIREAADLKLAVVQTANLSISDRVKANWPKLRKGMSFYIVMKLVGPQDTEGIQFFSALFGALSSPDSISNTYETDLYVLKFDNLKLTYWQLK